MSGRTSPATKPAVILCADWGKSPAKRAVYRADVAARRVERVTKWGSTATDLLVYAQATAEACGGPVLVGFDVPLGVPASFLSVFSGVTDTRLDFISLLQRARTVPRFYSETSHHQDWRPEQPFFSVPAGAGGLGSYIAETAAIGVRLTRQIDTQTGAKSLFIKSGIPGSVGSAACSLWQELAPLLESERQFRLWPFEGSLDELLQPTRVVVGEMYPRAAYATAISNDSPRDRARLVVAKTDASIRRAFLDQLEAARWVRWSKVSLGRLAEAEASEDDFDACVTAAAFLRCVLEDAPLAPERIEDPKCEGAMLGTGSINLALPQRVFVGVATPNAVRVATIEPVGNDTVARKTIPGASTAPRVYPCPIPDCSKVFSGSRGGWDGHVGSPTLHPAWHPTVEDPEERRHLFRHEFPAFFAR